MSLAVIGAGRWGSALHYALSINNTCMIASRTQKNLQDFVSLENALSCDYVVIALPAQVTKEWLEKNLIYKGQKFLIATKGIELTQNMFMNELYEQHIPKDNLAYLSGPSFAAEVMQSLPTALTISSYNEKLPYEFGIFFPDFIKTFVSDDVVGANLCGAYKNVLAIASGMCDGLGLGNNARASIISLGLVEMTEFAQMFGAKKTTFLGLGGAGDLFLTASSTLSRNYRVGQGLASGKELEAICEEIGEVTEGVHTIRAVCKIAKAKNFEAKIANKMLRIIDKKTPISNFSKLLKRN